VAPTYLSFDTNTRAGKLATVTGDIEKLTGKAPITLKAFFEVTKDAFLAA
jgi:NAD(P)H dehydrogenase (quinone)